MLRIHAAVIFCLTGALSPAHAEKALLDHSVEAQLGSIESGTTKQRKEALAALAEMLKQTRGHATSDLRVVTRDRMTKALMNGFRREHGATAESAANRYAVAELITSHGQSVEAKNFLDELMASGDDIVRNNVMLYLGHPDGVSGEDLIDKISVWANKGYIPRRARFSLMSKVEKHRAVTEILNAIDATTAPEEIQYATWALQNIGSNADLARAFKKVRDVGLHKGEGALYWVDKKRFTEYALNSTGENLKVALELMQGSQTMRPLELIPLLIDKISDPDTDIRTLAIARLEESGGNYRMDYEAALKAIELRIPLEKDAGLNRKLTHCVRTLKRHQEHAKAFLLREQEWIKKNAK